MTRKQLEEIQKRYHCHNHRSLIVEEIRSGLVTSRQACQTYGLSYWHIRKWNRWYYRSRLAYYFQLYSSGYSLYWTTAMKNNKIERLKKQLADSEAKIQQLELEKEVLNTVINLAEKEFSLEIRKKYGSRPSHK